MKNIMKILMGSITLCLTLTVFAPWTLCAEEEAEKYVIALPMISGFEDTKLASILNQLSGVIAKKLGCEVTSESLVFNHDERIIDVVRKRFQEGTADVSYVTGLDIGEYDLDGDDDLNVIAVLGMKKSDIEKACFFTRKGEYSDVSELRGERWMGAQPIMTRFLMKEKGIDERIDAFFGSLAFGTDSPILPMMEKLKAGEIDVFTTYLHTVWLTGELGKKDSFIEPLFCKDIESHWVFVVRKGVPMHRVNQMREILLKAHKDKDFAQFHFAFKMVDGHFVRYSKRAKKVNADYAEAARKGGWHKEAVEFFEKYYKKDD